MSLAASAWRPVAAGWRRRSALVVFVVWSATAPIVWLLLSSLLQQQALIAQPPDFSPAVLHARQLSSTVFGSAAQLGRGIAQLADRRRSSRRRVAIVARRAGGLCAGAAAGAARQRHRFLMVLATQMFPAIVIAIPLFIAASASSA